MAPEGTDVLSVAALCASIALWTTQASGASESYDEAKARAIAMLVDDRLPVERADAYMAAVHVCLAHQPQDPLMAYCLSFAHALKGEVDAALEWMGKSLEWGYGRSPRHLAMIALDPDLDALRADPRGQRLFREAQELLKSDDPALPAFHIDWASGHRLTPSQVAFSPDGSRILTACQDGWGRVWDSTTGELLVLFGGNLDRPGICAWVDAGRTLLTAGSASMLRTWDARTGELLRVVPGTEMGMPGALSRDGNLVACPSGNRLRLFDLRSNRGMELRLTAQIFGVDFDPGAAHYAVGCADGTTSLFEPWSREPVATHRSPGPVFDVAFSPDGRWLVAAGADGTVRWLEARTLEPVRVFRAHVAEINSITFSPDGRDVLTTSVDLTAKVWSAAEDRLRLELTGHGDEVLWAAYSADGTRIATPSGDGTVRLWDARDGALLLTLPGLRGGYGRTLEWWEGVLTTFDKFVRAWDPATGAEVAVPGTTPVVRFRPAHGHPAYEVKRHEPLRAGADVVELEGVPAKVVHVVVSPDGRLVFGLDDLDGRHIWSTATGTVVRDLAPLGRPEPRAGSGRASACFSPDGTLLATALNAGGATLVLEAETGLEVAALAGGGTHATAVAFDPAGKLLAAARTDTSVDLWDVQTMERLRSLSGHRRWARQLAFRTDGRLLASAGQDGTVRLWDVQSGECQRVLEPAFADIVVHVEFSPDGRRIAAALNDGRVTCWDADAGRLLGTIVPGAQPGDWFSFAPSGHYHGTPAAIHRSSLVQGAVAYPLTCFAAILESPEQVRAGFAGTEVEPPKLPAPPTLVVARPIARTSSVEERVAHVQALATEPLAGLARIDVSQDGTAVSSEVLARALTLEDNERLARLDLRLPIPVGAMETRITLQAVSTRGIESRPESYVVRHEPPKNELYLLALGVADYVDDALDLACPVQDVDGLVARLQAQQGALFQDVHVERRVDREVTSAEALRLREEFLLRAGREDTIVVFLAGHGTRSSTGEFWFLTSDATPDRPYSGIKRADVESLVTWDKLHASRRVLLLDTCNSGSSFGKGTRGERGIAFQQTEVDTLLESSTGLYILAATSDDGFAREQSGNGIFTRALLDGLAGAADAGDFGNKDGTVGIDELMHFARYAVLERSAGRQQPTFPRIEGGQNFPLARCDRPRPPPLRVDTR